MKTNMIRAVKYYWILALLCNTADGAKNEGDKCFESHTKANGTCTPLLNCATSSYVYRTHNIRFDICNVVKNKAVVCCVENLSNIATTTLTKKQSFGESCGLITPRHELPPNLQGDVVPWQASIFLSKDGTNKIICGGSIINEKAIISVAHCYYNEYGQNVRNVDLIAAAGKTHTTWDNDLDDSRYVQKSKVRHISLPERYSGSKTYMQADISILVLDEGFSLSPLVKPICIDFQSPLEQLSKGDFGKVTTWNFRNKFGTVDSTSGLLKLVPFPFISYRDCLRDVTDGFKPYLVWDKFCGLQITDEGPCSGDSGNGFAFTKRDASNIEKSYLVGVVSVSATVDGKPSCMSGSYVGFTKISAHLDFIRDVLSEYQLSN